MYLQVVLRVQFPDRHVLQGFFRPLETGVCACVCVWRVFISAGLATGMAAMFKLLAAPYHSYDCSHTRVTGRQKEWNRSVIPGIKSTSAPNSNTTTSRTTNGREIPSEKWIILHGVTDVGVLCLFCVQLVLWGILCGVTWRILSSVSTCVSVIFPLMNYIIKH